MPYLLILINILLMTSGQLLFKQSAVFLNKHKDLGGFEKFFFNPWFYMAIVSFAIATIIYIKILTTLQLSTAYPVITTLAYILTIYGSVYFFSEKITPFNILGVLIILIGITISSIK